MFSHGNHMDNLAVLQRARLCSSLVGNGGEPRANGTRLQVDLKAARTTRERLNTNVEHTLVDGGCDGVCGYRERLGSTPSFCRRGKHPQEIETERKLPYHVHLRLTARFSGADHYEHRSRCLHRRSFSRLYSNVDSIMKLLSVINALVGAFRQHHRRIKEREVAVFGTWRSCSSWTSYCPQWTTAGGGWGCGYNAFALMLPHHSATEYLYRQRANDCYRLDHITVVQCYPIHAYASCDF
ncbi:hypothetical protein C8F01DRAFT_1145600 [Mycena amicta]|nr:hypothetical protein C8F01DRAFT_1145600 [Mycena amicta]